MRSAVRFWFLLGFLFARFHQQLTERQTHNFDAVSGGHLGGLKMKRDGKAVWEALGFASVFGPFAGTPEEAASMLILNDVAHGTMFVALGLRSIRGIT